MVLKEQDTTTHIITTERGLHNPGQTNRNEYISEENLEWKRKAYEEDKEHTRAHAQTHTHTKSRQQKFYGKYQIPNHKQFLKEPNPRTPQSWGLMTGHTILWESWQDFNDSKKMLREMF